MSTIHFSTAELANVLAACTVRESADFRLSVLKTLADCSTANTYAALSDNYPGAVASTAADLLDSKPLAFSLERAASTLSSMSYNCNGFLGDKVGAEVGRLLALLMSRILQVLAESKESVKHQAEQISALRAAAKPVKTAPRRRTA
jgi:hypothetical protein